MYQPQMQPPDRPYLKGALLPNSSRQATGIGERILATVVPSLTLDDPVLDNQSVFLSIGDIKSMLLQYEYDKVSSGMASLLQVYVQHGSNKLRSKLPIYQTSTTIFERYMDQYLEFAVKKQYVERVGVRNASADRTVHLEYKFKAPNLPPFGNKNWCTKLYSTIFYDYVKTKHELVVKKEHEANVESDMAIKMEPGVKVDTESDVKPNIDWQHVATGVLYAVFYIEVSTGLVSCNLKLKTMKLVETKGLITQEGMHEIEEGWTDAL